MSCSKSYFIIGSSRNKVLTTNKIIELRLENVGRIYNVHYIYPVCFNYTKKSTARISKFSLFVTSLKIFYSKSTDIPEGNIILSKYIYIYNVSSFGLMRRVPFSLKCKLFRSIFTRHEYDDRRTD